MDDLGASADAILHLFQPGATAEKPRKHGSRMHNHGHRPLSSEAGVPAGWHQHAMHVLQTHGEHSPPSSPGRQRPASRPFPATQPAAPFVTGSSTRPASASLLVPGYIASPGHQYAQPPAVIITKSHQDGYEEGQLQYQVGKLAPVIPAYATSWVHDPPQRLSVMDVRLSPSQRSLSCYSPEFLSGHQGFLIDPPRCRRRQGAGKHDASSRVCDDSATHSAGAQQRQQQQQQGYESIAAAVQPPAQLIPDPLLSPPGPHRGLAYTNSVFHRLKSAPGMANTMQPSAALTADAPGSGRTEGNISYSAPRLRSRPAAYRPCTAPPSSSYVSSTTTRWGGKTLGVQTNCDRARSGHSPQGTSRYFVDIKRGLARSPTNDMLRSIAKSVVATHGPSQRSSLIRAASACAMSRSHSMAAREGRDVPGHTSPARNSHFPNHTEAQQRMSRPATHETVGRVKK